MFCVNRYYFQIEFRPTDVNPFVSGPNFAPRKGTRKIDCYITWEPIKLSFSKFECMIGTSLLKIGEKKMGVAPKLTLPRPPIYGRCPFQRLSSNAHSDQLFSKNFFACLYTYLGLSKMAWIIFQSQILTDLEIFHFSFLSIKL